MEKITAKTKAWKTTNWMRMEQEKYVTFQIIEKKRKEAEKTRQQGTGGKETQKRKGQRRIRKIT